MGLFGGLFNFPAPGVIVELIGNYGLPALVDMNMPHGLLAWLVQLRQRLECCTAVALRLHSQPPIAFRSIFVRVHVERSAPGKLGEHSVERCRLGG